jgi:hypothetical protein
MFVKSGRCLAVLTLVSVLAIPGRAAAFQGCGGRPCPAGPHGGHCNAVPAGCVCEYSPRTGSWGAACPKRQR